MEIKLRFILRIAITLAVLFSGIGYAFKSKQDKPLITLERLLEEMTAVEQQARLPEPYYTTGQASSYDRASVSPNSAHWFANADGFGMVRVDTISGRIEKVLFDEKGPGAITRIWVTTLDKRGTWRFYFDGNTSPGWTVHTYDMMKFGLSELGEGLRQAHTSYVEDGKGGSTLFLPIPYAQSCKITFEDEKGIAQTPKYYQINFRRYPAGTLVETFSKAVAQRASAKIKLTDQELLTPQEPKGNFFARKALLQPGDSILLQLPAGENAVYQTVIQVYAALAKDAQLMRGLVLKGIFDDTQTIWVPVSDFSGGGIGAPKVKSWFLDSDGHGKMTSRWLMPFKRNGKLIILNNSRKSVAVSLGARVAPLKWDKRSLYFYVSWKQHRGLPLGDNPEQDSLIREWNFATLKGKGIYKGDVLSLFNYSPAWYGEGDEKIWVDADRFPSHFGTGTEDYYNSSWAPVVPFQTPFGGAPRADQESSHGYNTFLRTRNLDGITFSSRMKFDLELLSWIKGKADYSSTVFWYGASGAVAQGTSGMEEATSTLPAIPKDRSKYKEKNSVEFENLSPTLKSSSITLERQNMSGFPLGSWSGAAQTIGGGGKVGDRLKYNFKGLSAGKYQVFLYCTKAKDYAQLGFSLNGNPAVSFDGYGVNVTRERVDLGTYSAQNGTFELGVTISGRNQKMIGDRNMFGLDCIQFIKK